MAKSNLDPYPPGTIIQIVEKSHTWFGALLVVEKLIGNWGVQAYMTVPTQSDKREETDPITTAFARVEFGDFVSVGSAALVGGS